MQTSVLGAPAIAFAGMIADVNYGDIISRVLSQKQIVQCYVNDLQNTTHYHVYLDGTDYDYTSDGSATRAEITAGLLALVNAGAQAMTARSAISGIITDALILTQDNETTTVDSAEDTSEIAVTASANITVTKLLHQAGNCLFGRGLVRDNYGDTTGTYACLPWRTTEIAAGSFLGISVVDMTLQSKSARPAAGGYINLESVKIARRGRVWVPCEDTGGTEGSQVYIRTIPTEGSSKYCGAFRSDSDSSTATACPGVYIKKPTATAGGLMLVEINAS